ncbi:MAG: transglutaminase domain-containing protein [candidate division Zixibacteria bacterium]|nr:transglutaminase domain-containing protein [candidate division Zixibacteria bacterium]
MPHRFSLPSKCLPIIIIVGVMFTGCGRRDDSDISADIKLALKEAGDNRGEIERVLDYFAEFGDTLKLKAARYLVANMEGHSYVTYYLHDTLDDEISFDVLEFPDYDALLVGFENLENEHGPLDFDRLEIHEDLENVEADFLVGNIEVAFDVWRGKPWARQLSFENFCKYVLPYRGSNEPLEPWRETFRERYAHIDTLMVDTTDPIEAARLINEDIRSWFKFDPRYYYHPTDQGLTEMLENKMGRCEDMTNLTIYAMRANGLAVTSDYTPHWANSGNNHAWNAILTSKGEVIPFMGAESNPGDYHLVNKLAKVYRKMFGKQKRNLIFQKRKQEEVPGWLAGRSYLDVTADYVPVSEVTQVFDKKIPDSVDIAYLCVFNSGEWKAVHWGRIKNNRAVFSDMGRDIAYLPALYFNEEMVPYGDAFVLTEDGQITKYRADSSEKYTLELVSTTRRKQEISTDGVKKAFFTKDKEYELFYWTDGWQSLGKTTAGEGPLIFGEAPKGGLYWLVEDNSDKEERIFTYEDGRQVWW